MTGFIPDAECDVSRPPTQGDHWMRDRATGSATAVFGVPIAPITSGVQPCMPGAPCGAQQARTSLRTMAGRAPRGNNAGHRSAVRCGHGLPAMPARLGCYLLAVGRLRRSPGPVGLSASRPVPLLAGRRCGRSRPGGSCRFPVTRGRAAGLTDRRSERATLDQLVDAVQGGQSRALVIRGDPGVGKTVLLDYLAGQARDRTATCR